MQSNNKEQARNSVQANHAVTKLIESIDTPEELVGEDGLLRQMAKQMFERALQLELQEHLAKQSGSEERLNRPAGTGKRRLQSEFGPIEIDVPRDQDRTFQPKSVRRNGSRLATLDEKVMALYARGMSPAEISAQIHEFYGAEISPATVSNIADTAMDEFKAWQSRPLDPVYPIVYLDCLFVKVREGTARGKAVYLAIGVNATGEKETLGIWIAPTEGAKFWLQVLTELKNRGVQDILIACVDGLKGFPDAIATVFPEACVQLCIVHMVRHSLNFVAWKRRAEVAADIKRIYGAATVEEAEKNLGEFEAKWGNEYPTIGQSWRRNWENVIPFFDQPKEIRKVIYTTNAIESVNMSLRRAMRYRGTFQNDDALLKLLYLSLRSISKRWTRPVRNWPNALGRFAIQFENRIR